MSPIMTYDLVKPVSFRASSAIRSKQKRGCDWPFEMVAVTPIERAETDLVPKQLEFVDATGNSSWTNMRFKYKLVWADCHKEVQHGTSIFCAHVQY